MANLLSWFGDRLKDVENGIGGVVNNVGKAVGQAFAPQPQQPRPQPPRQIAQPQRPTPFNSGVGAFNMPKPQVSTIPRITRPTVPQTQPQNDWLHQAGSFVNDNIVKPVVEDVSKAYNTVAAPVTGAVGVGTALADKTFNNGRNYQNILNATKAQMDENIGNSFVPQDIASGKASPAQFAGGIAKTGIQLAPYAVPGIGGMADKFGTKVAENIGNNVVRAGVGSIAKNAVNSAVATPTFAALNAAQQGIDSGFRSFDPSQAVGAGLQAGALTLGSGLAGDIARGSTGILSKRIEDTVSQPGYNSQAGFAKVPGVGEQPSPVSLPANLPRRTVQAQNISSPKQLTPEQTGVGELEKSLSPRALDNNTSIPQPPQLDVNSYVKQQYRQQEAARKQGNPGVFTKLRDNISTKMIDSLSPIENTLKKANKNGANIQIGDANHITTQLDRAIRADTIAGQYIKDNGLAKVIQSAPNTKALDQYLIAKHAADLEAGGVKTGRNLEADRQLVESLKSTYEPYAQAIMKYNQNLLDKTAEYGLISKETAAQLKKQYPNYVPANRIFGEGENTTYKGNGAGKASISSQSVVQRIKGSSREIESPLASIAAKTTDVIKQGERNRAASILASYKDLPGNPFGLRELKASETVGVKPTISYLDNGKVRRFETTPEIAAAAKSLNKEQMGILGKIVSVPTRVLRLGATGVNVGFALANIAKDMASAAINSRHPLRSSVLNLNALKKATAASLYHGGRSYGELVREGAGGTSFDIARDAPKQTVGQIRSQRNPMIRAAYTIRHPGELLRAVENTIGRSEEFTRALQYYGNKNAALSKGMSIEDATRYGAHAARNNTVNFARMGEYGAVLNSALPYLNAGIQGARTFVRNVRERPLQTTAKVAVLSTLPAVTTTMWNVSSPDRKAAYDDISDYEKAGNLIIVPEHPVKDPKTGRWNVIKIPVSQELANLNNIARNTIEAAAGDKNFDVAGALADLIGTTTSANVTSARGTVNQVTPQIIKPSIEALTNQNLFTGNQIVPDSQQNLPANEQYGQYTSGTSKVLGNTFGLSPRVIDNSAKTILGGAGQNVVNTSDSVLKSLGVIKPEEVQGKSLQDSVQSRFIGAAGKPASEYASKSYGTARDQLMKDPAFQALSQDDKSKALNRLQTDINAVEYKKYDANNPGSNYTPKDLTTNQQGLVDGSRAVSDYAVASDGNTRRKSYADKYAAAQKEFDKNSKDWSSLEKMKKQKELSLLKVKKDYSNDTVDLYDMNKADVYNFVSTDPNGKKYVDDILKYGDALVDAGLAKKNKFRDKYGNVKLDDGSAKGGKKGRKKGGKAPKPTTSIPKTSVPRVAQPPSFGAKGAIASAIYKQTPLKRYGKNIPALPKGVKTKKIA